MRTTLHIDDEAYRIVIRYAKDRKIGVGQAVSELVVKAARAKLPVKQVDGVFVFDLPPDSPEVTHEQVKRAITEMEEEAGW